MGDEPPFPGNRRYTPCRYPKATYAAMVSLLDEQIGGLLRLLKELDLYENTLLVFTGGNRVTDDIYVDELETYRSEIAVNRRISGKLSLAEKKLHVPMIVSWPKEIVAGTTSGILTSSYDVMATFCDLAHIEAPVTDGISIYPALLGKNRKQKEHECLYWEHSASDGEVAVRFGSWKAIVGEVMKGNRTIRLFDMQTDPNEQCDVAAQNPEIVEQALQFIKREHTSPHLKIFDFPTW